MCLATDYVLLGILLSDVRKDSECIHRGIQKERKKEFGVSAECQFAPRPCYIIHWKRFTRVSGRIVFDIILEVLLW